MAGKAKFDQEAAFKSIIAGTAAEPEQAAKPTKTSKQAAAGKGRPKADRETKKLVSLALYPSSYSDLQNIAYVNRQSVSCLLYTSPSPRDGLLSRMPTSA